MTFVVQRAADQKFFTGIYRAEWSGHVSAALAYSTKEMAIEDMRSRGFQVRAMFFEALPRVKQKIEYKEMT